MRMAKTLNVKALVAFEIFNKAEVSPVRACSSWMKVFRQV